VFARDGASTHAFKVISSSGQEQVVYMQIQADGTAGAITAAEYEGVFLAAVQTSMSE
jgi:hypothetical protein